MKYLENLIAMTIEHLEELNSKLDSNDYEAMLQIMNNIMNCTLQTHKIIKREKANAEAERR